MLRIIYYLLTQEKQPSLMSNKDNVYVEHIGDLLRHLATNDQNTYLTMIDTCAKVLFWKSLCNYGIKQMLINLRSKAYLLKRKSTIHIGFVCF